MWTYLQSSLIRFVSRWFTLLFLESNWPFYCFVCKCSRFFLKSNLSKKVSVMFELIFKYLSIAAFLLRIEIFFVYRQHKLTLCLLIGQFNAISYVNVFYHQCHILPMFHFFTTVIFCTVISFFTYFYCIFKELLSFSYSKTILRLVFN